jgi:hypothetical protein
MATGFGASIFFYVWGVYCVFTTYSTVQYTDIAALNYCEKDMFQPAFIMLIISSIMAIPFVVALPFMFCSLCCANFEPQK